MADIKYIALDIFGTLLSTYFDPGDEKHLPPRKGWREFFSKCRDRGIKLIAASDASYDGVRFAMVDAGILKEDEPIEGDLFYDVIQCPTYPVDGYLLKRTPKDFSRILEKYKISSLELLVIGDNPDTDIEGAKMIGARFILVPEYYDNKIGGDFDLGKLVIG